MFGSIFNLNMLLTILVAIVDDSHHQKSQKWLSTKAPPFNIEACNKKPNTTTFGCHVQVEEWLKQISCRIIFIYLQGKKFPKF